MAVYRLKHATPKMKYHHMLDMMDRKAQIRDAINNPTDREYALAQIKQVMNGPEYTMWFNDTYRLRSAGKDSEYEQAIFTKLNELSHTPTIQPNIQA